MSEPFFKACKDGNVERVAASVSSENVNCQHVYFYEYWTPLMIAVKEGHTEVVIILLSRNDVDIRITQKSNFRSAANTVLHIACEYGNPECLELLLKDRRITEELINKKNYKGQTPLSRCRYKKHIGLMLNHSEVDISADFESSNTVLHFSCLNGFAECVKFLLKDPRLTSEILNKRYLEGNTSLMEAIQYPEIVKMLLARKDLDLTICNSESDTALNIAFNQNINESVTLLLEDSRLTFDIFSKGDRSKAHFQELRKILIDADKLEKEVRHREGSSLIFLACKFGLHDIVKKLIRSRSKRKSKKKRKRDLAFFDDKGNTALHVACENGFSDCAKAVVRAKEMTPKILNKMNNNGVTALAETFREHREILKLLVANKHTDLSATDKDGDTALHVACLMGFSDCVEFLLKDPRMTQEIVNKQNKHGNTAIFAIMDDKMETPETLRMLLRREDVNLAKINNDGETVLHRACIEGIADHVKLLIEDERITTELINKQVDNGDTALIEVAKRHPEILSILLSRDDLDLAITNCDDRSALHELCHTENAAEYVDLLLDDPRMTGDILNKWDFQGKTILMESDIEIKRKLFAKEDFDVGAVDGAGNTSLHLACYEGNTDLVNLLMHHKTMNEKVINKKNEDGDTSLMTAVKNGKLESLKEISKLDLADWKTKDNMGKGLKDVAKNLGHFGILKYIKVLEHKKKKENLGCETLAKKKKYTYEKQKVEKETATMSHISTMEKIKVDHQPLAIQKENSLKMLKSAHKELADEEAEEDLESEGTGYDADVEDSLVFQKT